MRALWMLVVVPAVAFAAPPPPPSTARFEKLTAPKGASQAELTKRVKERLSELEACVNFTVLQGNAFVPMTDFDQRDDLVEVKRLEPSEKGEPITGVYGWLTNMECAEAVINEWKLPQGVTFTYRHRPSQEQREAARAKNRAGLEALCAAFKGTTADVDVTKVYDSVKDRVPAGLRFDLDIPMMMASVNEPAERGTALTDAWVAAARTGGVALGCPVFESWQPVSDADLARTAKSSASCASLVAGLRTLAQQPAPLLRYRDGDLQGTRGQLATEPGLEVELGAVTDPHPLLPQPQHLKEFAAEQVKVQGKKRPILYVRLHPNRRAADLVEGVEKWSKAFELRALLTGPQSSAASSVAPALASALLTPLKDVMPMDVPGVLLSGFQRDEALCKGTAAIGAAITTPVPERVTALAQALEGCGCPQKYAEVAAARGTLAMDRFLTHVRWLPLDFTKKKGAKVVKVERSTPTQELFDQLGDEPVNVTWSN